MTAATLSEWWTAAEAACCSCRFVLLRQCGLQVVHQRTQAIGSQCDVGTGGTDLDPNDEQLHDPRLLGGEQLSA